MHKYFTLVLLILLSDCGTTGHVAFYNFSASKKEVEISLSRVINKDSNYTVPAKWKDVGNGDVLERKYIYFKTKPEEIYQIGFTGDTTEWNYSSTCKLGLIGVFNGEEWKFEKNLPAQEKKRVQNRFESEILSKTEYTFYKTD